MAIQVTGVLKTPLDTVSSRTVIRVISQANGDGTLTTLPGRVVTGTDGTYNFQLVNGKHRIEVNFSKKYNLVGTVTITDATTSPLTLPALLNL